MPVSPAAIAAPKIAPRGLRRTDAAAYIAVSPSKFDQWVEEGVMPSPIRKEGIVVWDRLALDIAFDALAEPEHSPWDNVRV